MSAIPMLPLQSQCRPMNRVKPCSDANKMAHSHTDPETPASAASSVGYDRAA